MIASVGILAGETVNPLFDHKITGPAIYQFQQADELVSYFWVGVLFFIALIEGQNILTGWESPKETKNRAGGIAYLKEVRPVHSKTDNYLTLWLTNTQFFFT